MAHKWSHMAVIQWHVNCGCLVRIRRGGCGIRTTPWKITSYKGFYRNKHLDPPPPGKKLDQCFKSLVRPILEYSSSVWDPHTQRNVNKLEMVQRRAARFVKDQQRDIDVDRSPLEYSPRKEDASQVSHALQDCAQPGCHPCHTFPYTSKNLQRTQHEVLHPSVNGELTSILLLPKHHPHMEPAARVCRLSTQLRDLQASTDILHLLNTQWNHVLDCT